MENVEIGISGPGIGPFPKLNEIGDLVSSLQVSTEISIRFALSYAT